MDASEEKPVAASAERVKPNYPGPKPGVRYPLNLVYCGECSLPFDLCEYSPNPEACKDWLNKNHQTLNIKLESLQINESGEKASGGDEEGAAGGGEAGDGEKRSSHQKRGGKAIPKSKKEKQPSKVVLTKNQRKGNKFVTVITGLEANDVDLETAKKFFASKFCCGCSKGEVDELTIQGDFVDQLLKVIPEKFAQITLDMIEVKEKS